MSWMDGPFYDDLEPGQTIPPLPPVTLGEADNLWYRALSGDQYLPSTDHRVSARLGALGIVVNPGLVLQYSIGQTTNTTRRAIANLYYRSVRLLRPVVIGETLETETKVLGLADARPKDGQHRGKVWIGIETRSAGELVAAYERCALLPCRGEQDPGHATDIPGPAEPGPLAAFADAVPAWDLSALPASDWEVGEERADPMRDHIDLAPALARMTFNQAFVHRDGTRTPSGRRLVYGGHVQALAQASLTRVLPGLASVLGWDGCDHLGPAFEGDLLTFRHTLVEREATERGSLLRVETRGAPWTDSGQGQDLLAWTSVVLAP